MVGYVSDCTRALSLILVGEMNLAREENGNLKSIRWWCSSQKNQEWLRCGGGTRRTRSNPVTSSSIIFKFGHTALQRHRHLRSILPNTFFNVPTYKQRD